MCTTMRPSPSPPSSRPDPAHARTASEKDHWRLGGGLFAFSANSIRCAIVPCNPLSLSPSPDLAFHLPPRDGNSEVLFCRSSKVKFAVPTTLMYPVLRVTCAAPIVAVAQDAPGAAIYAKSCAMCHDKPVPCMPLARCCSSAQPPSFSKPSIPGNERSGHHSRSAAACRGRPVARKKDGAEPREASSRQPCPYSPRIGH